MDPPNAQEEVFSRVSQSDEVVSENFILYTIDYKSRTKINDIQLKDRIYTDGVYFFIFYHPNY
jgi:hypothetical protein